MKILSFDCHEALLCMFANLDAEFDLVFYSDQYSWREEIRPIPKNVNILHKHIEEVDVSKYDCILANNYWKQYQLVKNFNKHVFLYPAINEEIGELNEPNTTVVFCGYRQKINAGESFSNAPVVWYGLNVDEFNRYKGERKLILTAIHDLKERDSVCGYTMWKEFFECLPLVNYGDGEGGSLISHEDVKQKYRDYAIYFDPTSSSPMSFSVLEAMASGMPVVTTPHDDHRLFIKDGINGVISSDKEYLKERILQLLDDKKERKVMGMGARNTIEEYFNIKDFKKNWESIL